MSNTKPNWCIQPERAIEFTGKNWFHWKCVCSFVRMQWKKNMRRLRQLWTTLNPHTHTHIYHLCSIAVHTKQDGFRNCCCHRFAVVRVWVQVCACLSCRFVVGPFWSASIQNKSLELRSPMIVCCDCVSFFLFISFFFVFWWMSTQWTHSHTDTVFSCYFWFDLTNVCHCHMCAHAVYGMCVVYCV